MRQRHRSHRRGCDDQERGCGDAERASTPDPVRHHAVQPQRRQHNHGHFKCWRAVTKEADARHFRHDAEDMAEYRRLAVHLARARTIQPRSTRRNPRRPGELSPSSPNNISEADR